MSRYIDADALDRAFSKLRFNNDGELNHYGDRPNWYLWGSEIENLIADAPSIDLADYVPKDFHDKTCEAMAKAHQEEIADMVRIADRPQGEWIDEADEYDASFGIHDYRCSNCNSYADEYIGGHEWYTAGKPNFCPYCGADMREREGE